MRSDWGTKVLLALLLSSLCAVQAGAYVQYEAAIPPDQEFPQLFEAVQMSGVFSDSKTFADAVPKKPPEEIRAAFKIVLEQFVRENFELPEAPDAVAPSGVSGSSGPTVPIEEHLIRLWPVLTRQPDPRAGADKGGSLIPLPNPYIVPGGRFREIYYWDSYFTMLGLQVAGDTQMIRDMVENFAYLLDEIGHIPNGNRSYFVSRSQPPYFAMMVGLLAEEEGDEVLGEYLPQMEKEYRFWMDGAGYPNGERRVGGGTGDLGSQEPHGPRTSHRRVVLMPNGRVLNRYWDDYPEPRQEAYQEDVETARQSDRAPRVVYRNLRAGAESGWDFSSRWLADGKTLATIETTNILPICLNALLYNLERTLARAYALQGDGAKQQQYVQLAGERRDTMQTYMWDDVHGAFQDYDFVERRQTGRWSLAMSYPLFFEFATPEQAERVAVTIERDFLKPGGLITTPVTTGQQWDAPNGWAPLQWLTIKGLRNYERDQLADTIAGRWIDINEKVYASTGKMMEKYNVVDIFLAAGGGEYLGQDGFGWTNGVLLGLLHDDGDGGK